MFTLYCMLDGGQPNREMWDDQCRSYRTVILLHATVPMVSTMKIYLVCKLFVFL